MNTHKHQTLQNSKDLETHKKIFFVGNTMQSMLNFRGHIIHQFAKTHDVCVLAPFDGAEKTFLAKNISCIDLKIARKSLNPFKDLNLLIQLFRIYKAQKPDLIFHYTIKPCIWGSMAANFLNIKNIAVITGLGYAFTNNITNNFSNKPTKNFIKNSSKNLLKNLLKKLVCKLYKFALKKTQNICFLNTGDEKIFLEKKLIQTKQAYLLMGEGVDCEYYNYNYKNNNLNNINDINHKPEINFLLIARILYDKGIAIYAQAADILYKKYPKINYNLNFNILGDFDFENPSAIPIDVLKSWSIQYLGSANDVRPYIANNDCVVLPSFSEGLPRVLLEAMSMQKPIVATKIAGCMALINQTENINGFLCEVANPESLADALEKIILLKLNVPKNLGRNLEIDLEIDLEIMGKNGLAKVEKFFTVEKVYQQYLDLINLK